ncbi:MAG: restriction endonuclease subunit S [Candidatus Eisenbacteria bacterium]|uniref:Restriction endonuclease subunit S n=1 Tax=Eiseniibacteriota bacterium TaxID=2212470 RepID=A0A956NGR7_UNCEI|nr:restriction endonuclease subunit S [Candidatus Eisenbacteria bacterium]NMG50006.1 hypothetical protein [Parazoarcus communis]
MDAPKLRFPEFSGSWKPAKAGEAFKNNRTRGREGLPIYSVTMDRGMVRRDSIGREIEADAADGANLRAQPGDLAYNMMRMWQGAVGRAPEECMVSPAYVVLSPKPGVASDFFEHWFRSKRMLYLFRAYSQGLTSDRLRLYFDDFAQIPLRIPAPDEQEKIAAFLSALDDRIAQLRARYEWLTKYKKGVVRKLFAQDVRFKDAAGCEFPDWQESSFGEVAELRNWKYDPDTSAEALRCVELEHVSQETGRLLGYVDSKLQRSVKNRFAAGDVLFGKLRPYLRKYLKAPFDGACSTEIWVLNGKKVTNDFLFYLVQSESFMTTAQVSSGSKMPRADWGVVSSGEVAYPCPEEQAKIAGFLFALDAQIACAESQLESAKRYKQGILRNMFIQ